VSRVVRQWNRDAVAEIERKCSAVQCEGAERSEVQGVRKKLGVSGVEGASWFGDGSLARGPPRTEDTNRSGPRQGRCAHKPGQASANYDRLRGEGEGRRGERFNVVNHTQVLERRSAVQFGSGFGPKCVFTLDGSQE
jgi:hypothetical protein